MDSQSPKSPGVYSRHILFFPFQWRPILPATQRMDAVQQALEAIKEAPHWKGDVYQRKTDYSTYNYFHDFVHPALMEQKAPQQSQVWNFQFTQELPAQLAVLEEALPAGLRDLAQASPQGKQAIFHLKLFKARLNIYETGIGILVMYLDNFECRKPEAVLVINDLIRRLYPLHLNYNTGVIGPKKEGVLPQSMSIGEWTEDWSAFPQDGNKDNIPSSFLPKYITGLLGNGFHLEGAADAQTGLSIQPVLDDRMYLLSMLVDAELAQRLSRQTKGKYAYEQDDFWYSYVFADKGEPQIAHDTLKAELIRVATHARWAGKGSLYGASRYSFAAVLAIPALKTPMTNNYLLLVELCLAQRASALRYREETSSIAAQLALPEPPEGLEQQIRRLYGEYIRFVNRFNFLEATPVEQGIELYDLLRRQMRVQEQVEGLKTELEELHRYAALLFEEKRAEEEEKRNRSLTFLTVLGGAFLLPSLLLSYWAFSDAWTESLEKSPVFLACVLGLGGALTTWLFYSNWLHTKGWRRWLGIALMLAYFLLLYFLPKIAPNIPF